MRRQLFFQELLWLDTNSPTDIRAQFYPYPPIITNAAVPKMNMMYLVVEGVGRLWRGQGNYFHVSLHIPVLPWVSSYLGLLLSGHS